MERGATAIPEAQEAIEPDLDEMGTVALRFAQVMQDEVVPPPMVTPSEGVEFDDEFRRLAGKALFEQAGSTDVADQVITSLEAMQPQG